MSYGLGDQLERRLTADMIARSGKPWKRVSRPGYARNLKRFKHHRERQRARLNPECAPEYKRFSGWGW
jgi:hypothetical protein